MSTAATRLRNHQLDLRDMLLLGGVGQFVVLLALPYMNFLPATCDPYSQGVQLIVSGLQRLLNQRGAKLVVDGGMGDKTVKALVRYAGPRWGDKSWAQLYGDVIAGKPWQGFVRNDRSPGNALNRVAPPAPLGAWDYTVAPRLSGDLSDSVTDLVSNPLVLAAGGFFVWWKFFRKKRSSTSNLGVL